MPWSWSSTKQVVLAEDLLESAGLLERRVEALVHQGLQDVSAEASGGGDDTVGVLREDLPVHLGLHVVALEERPGGELDEVLVPGVVLGEQGEVVVRLAPRSGLSPGVVHLSRRAGRSKRLSCAMYASKPMTGLTSCFLHAR